MSLMKSSITEQILVRWDLRDNKQHMYYITRRLKFTTYVKRVLVLFFVSFNDTLEEQYAHITISGSLLYIRRYGACPVVYLYVFSH